MNFDFTKYDVYSKQRLLRGRKDPVKANARHRGGMIMAAVSWEVEEILLVDILG